MSKHFCLIYFRGQPRRATVLDDTGSRWQLQLEDGEALRFPKGQVLFQWEGVGAGAESPGDQEMENLHQSIQTFTSNKGEPVSFGEIASHILSPEANGDEQAALFEAMLAAGQYFRHTPAGFVARTAEEMAQREVARRERDQKAQWAAAAERAFAALSADIWPPPESDGMEEFLEQLQSILAHEKNSPYWEALAGPLDLSKGSPELWRPRVKRWLVVTGAWKDWPRIWLRRAEVPEAFSSELLKASDQVAGEKSSLTGRVDYREQVAYTMDTQGAKDLDDGFSILEVDSDGLTVQVHIAEPANGLNPGEPLFEEAQRRVSTVYTPDKVWPMLPPVVSEHRFSLLAGEDREAVTFTLRLDNEGEVHLKRVERSLVHVVENLDYPGGDKLLVDHPETFGRLAELCEASRSQRVANGAGVNEARLEVRMREEQGRVLLEKYDRSGPAQRMIEELAILTNREAGRYCRDHNLPGLYRAQPYAPPPGAAESTPRPPARFSTTPQRHAGLACDAYIQVTSPIRRFPDLLMQRQIAAHASGEGVTFSDVQQMGTWGQIAEQRMVLIAETERRILYHWKRRHLSGRIGDTLQGVVKRVGHDGWGRVWLEDVLLMVDARLPGHATRGDGFHCKIVEVELDRERVVVEI